MSSRPCGRLERLKVNDNLNPNPNGNGNGDHGNINLNPNLNDNLNENKNLVPTIVMGDFNDVPGSPTLNILERAGLKDAWWEGGCGYGATIHHPLPYRIDHILHNDGLKLKSIKKIVTQDLSDHDALVARFVF